MKRKLFTFLMAFLATLSGAVWAQNEYENISGRETVIEIDDDLEYYFTCESGVNKKGIVVKRGSSPTIYLKNTSFELDGSSIIIEDGATGKFVIEGNNSITAKGHDAAIKVTTDAEIVFLESSTGILNINVSTENWTDNSEVAIGNYTWGSAYGGNTVTCGSVQLYGGTIITNGYIGRFISHDLWLGGRDMDGGNAVLIAKEITQSGDHKNYNSGIIFENTEEGTIYGTPTLNSSLPEPYKINLASDKKLEIGNNGGINFDQLIDNGGQVKGYKVVYSSPNNVPMTTSVALPAAKIESKTYTVAKWEDNAQAEEQTTTYKHIDTHWLKGGTEWVEANTEVTEEEPTYTTLSAIGTKEYQAVWYLQRKELTYSIIGGGFKGSFNLWYPENINPFTPTIQEGEGLTSLDAVGLQNTGNMVSAKSDMTVIAEGQYKVKMNLTPTASTNVPTMPVTELIVNVEEDELDITNGEDITVSLNEIDLTYDGNPKTMGNLVTVMGTKLQNKYMYGMHYTLVLTKDDFEPGQEVSGDFKDAGTYTVTVKAIEDAEKNSALTGEMTLTDKVTIKPASLTAEATDIEWTIGSEETAPDYTKAEFALKTVYDIDEDKVLIDKEAENFTGSVEGETWKTTPGTYPVSYAGLILTGSRAFNYTLGENPSATGNLNVSVNGTEQDPIDDEGEDPLITGAGDWENKTLTYDGISHPLTQIQVKNGTETERVTIPLEGTEITYSYKQTAEATEEIPATEVKNAGFYTATFTFPENQYGYKGIGKVSLEITKATFTVSAGTNNTISVVQNADIDQLNAVDYISITGVNNEKPTISGTLTPNEGVSTAEQKEFSNAFKFDEVEVDNSTNCLLSNYNEIIWPEIKLSVGSIIINPDIDGSDDGDEVIGGEDADGDGTFPSGGDIIILATGDAEAQNNVYNGSAHTLALLKIGDYTLAETTDYSVSYSSNDDPSLNDVKLPFHAATYSAEITLNEDGAYELVGGSKTFTLNNITIAQRPMMVSFVKEVSSVEDLDDINKLVQFEEMVGNRGLVDNEEPIVEATIETKDLGDGRYQVTIPRESFQISTNEAGRFYLSDYSIKVDFDRDGQSDADITDNDEDGTGELEDGDGTIDIEITVNSGKDDDDDTPDHGHGGSTGGINRPAKYYNIYVDTAATSDGVELSLSKDVVKEGNQVSVYIDKILEGYNAENMKVQIKRSLYGYWEEIEEGVQPDEYIIYNIYTDIYVKVTDVEKEDATGIDDLEGIKAYTKDGSIYVYTPNREEVIIISMSGAIIKNEEQVGLQSYSVSRGIYIVRIGDKVFKLKN